MKILQQRKYIEGKIQYNHVFDWHGHENFGFAFDCDMNGKTIHRSEQSKVNYQKCLSGEMKDEQGRPIVNKGIQSWTPKGYWEPAIGECNHCKAEVVLSGFTNGCECGVDYNQSGQELASRSQWGEETGESLGDILRIP